MWAEHEDKIPYDEQLWLDVHEPVPQELRPRLHFGRENPRRIEIAQALARELQLPSKNLNQTCCVALLAMMRPMADVIRSGIKFPEVDAASIGYAAVEGLFYPEELTWLVERFQLRTEMTGPVHADARLERQLRDHVGECLTERVAKLLRSWADQRNSGPPRRGPRR